MAIMSCILKSKCLETYFSEAHVRNPILAKPVVSDLRLAIFSFMKCFLVETHNFASKIKKVHLRSPVRCRGMCAPPRLALLVFPSRSEAREHNDGTTTKFTNLVSVMKLATNYSGLHPV